jgi:excisionase family DNA binding protein
MISKTSGSPEYLTADEVADMLRTSRKAVYAMAERAQLPGVVKLGRRLLIHRGDLVAWLDRSRAASPEVRR